MAEFKDSRTAGATLRGVLAALILSAATSCSGITTSPPPETPREPGLFGDNGISLLGRGNAAAERGGGAIGVNTFLWRASLDTISFLPLASADPFGGVIITDWYTPPESGGSERFKLTVFILDSQLRADGVRVSVFRQERDGAEWRDAQVAANTAAGMEDAILTRARQMWLDANAQP